MSKLVKNNEILSNILGYFPSFHDDEIRNVYFNNDGPNIEFEIIISRHHELDKSYMVKIVFSNISEYRLEDFCHQNAIFELKFIDINGLIKTDIISSIGLNGYIISSEVEIVSLKEII